MLHTPLRRVETATSKERSVPISLNIRRRGVAVAGVVVVEEATAIALPQFVAVIAAVSCSSGSNSSTVVLLVVATGIGLFGNYGCAL